ncbi:choice-of-anchor D domain-containing protein [Geobacter sulfurreducens]|uniref:RCC1 domain-containing protein n=1 Tax=Geobacter sulfurreducens TaxID=35554 RepID=UPI0001D8F134|nr:choice-of-anchor D domain-containing protein [Geobacter sulfurreducens]ADI84086.1 ATS1 domain repeat protein [Geobacter sulfurreducens KN400]
MNVTTLWGGWFKALLAAAFILATLGAPAAGWSAVPHVAAGGNHVLTLRSDGTLWAAGSNQFGQLGDGTGINRTSPVQVPGTWKTVAAGTTHSLGIKADGSLWAWGSNLFGQLGQPLVNGQLATNKFSPIRIGTGNDWVAVSAGELTSFGLKGDGTLWSWGNNLFGELGDGTTVSRPQPVQVVADPLSNGRYVAVAAGGEHALALQADGTLWAWGANLTGQLGTGGTGILPNPTPLKIGTDRDWTAISAGEMHSVALKADGSLWSWGQNLFGELGNGVALPGANVTTPTRVGTGSDWVAIAAGALHTVALHRNGTVSAWGNNAQGAVGDGTVANRSTPTLIVAPVTLVNNVAIAAGTGVSFSVLANGTVFGWGGNGAGQLGNGTFGAVTAPTVLSAGASAWLGVEPGGAFSLGLRSNGTLWAWGGNASGQLGDGTTTPSAIPVPVVGDAGNWRTTATGTAHSVAVRADGTLWAWGDNSSGQLGIGSTVAASTPQQITVTNPASAGNDWAAVAAGEAHTIGLKADGTLWAWGDNTFGQLGDGTGTSNRTTPVQIVTGNPGNFDRNWVAVAAGGVFSLALQADGTIWTWGDNSLLQLGTDPAVLAPATQRNVPAQLAVASPPSTAFNSSWVAIAAGQDHGLALQADGTLWAWGANSVGQLGNGVTTATFTPVQVINAEGVPYVSLAAGTSHSLAGRSDGTLWAWGNNTSGQLGTGPHPGDADPLNPQPHTVPARILTSNPVSAADDWLVATAGGSHSAALKSNGTLWTWGQNTSGQLGNGTTTEADIPTALLEPRISVSPASLAFGPAPIGIPPSPTRTLTITNLGSAPLSAAIASNNAAFTVNPAACNNLPPAGFCEITVTFVPALPVGVKSATLTITSNDPVTPLVSVGATGTAANPFFITASVDPASPVGSGTISPAGVQAVAAGGGATYTITAASGYAIVDVIVNGVSRGPIGSYTFVNVQQDQSIIALFAASVTISASSGPGGIISPTGTVSLPLGGSQKFTITPNPGYAIAGVNVIEMVEQLDVNGNGTGIFNPVPRALGPVSSFTFFSVRANGSSISATFVPRELHEWSWQNPKPQGQAISRIATDGNGTYVAVGEFGTILTSTDSVNWTVRTFGSVNLNSVAYGGNHTFVAVGSYGRILLSTDDGATWTVQSSGVTASLRGVAHSGTVFAAVGVTENNPNFPYEPRTAILTSPDGVTWTPRFLEQPFNGTLNLFDVAYGGGRFVAVGMEGHVVISEDNGGSWAALPPDPVTRPTNLNGVVFGAGTFVAVGDFGQIVTSTDGSNWVNRPQMSLAELKGVGFGTISDPLFAGNLLQVFTVVGTDGEILTSEDAGATWTFRTSGLATGGAGPMLQTAMVGLNRGVTPFVPTVIVAGSEGNLLASPDTVSWTNLFTTITRYPLRSIAWGNGTFVAVGDGDPGTTLHPPISAPTVLTSTNTGLTWTRRYLAPGHNIRGIAYGNGVFVAVGASGYDLDQNAGRQAIILTSSDGITWTPRSSGTFLNLNAVTFANGRFVAVSDYNATGDVADEGALILVSTNGITWNTIRKITSTAGNLRSVIAGTNGTTPALVAVGDFGTVMRSIDNGQSWTEVTSGTINFAELNGIAFNNTSNTYAAIGITSEVFTSTDNGATWNMRFLPVDDTLLVRMEGITYAYGSFVAVGNDNHILTSPDGASWTINIGAEYINSSLYGVAAGNGSYIAVGSDGTILQSNRLLDNPPIIGVNPTSLTFGITPEGTLSTGQVITISNLGINDLTIGALGFDGSDAGEFTISEDFCSQAVIPATGSCTVVVTFAPTSAGGKSAELKIPSNDPDSDNVEVPVSGTAIPRYLLTVTNAGNGTGSIAGSPAGISIANGAAGASSSALFVVDTAVTLTATPAAGSIFEGWSGAGAGACSGTTTPCTLIMSQARNVTATFTRKFIITATAGANGSISPSGQVLVNPGANQAFTITPAPGYGVLSVLVNGLSVGAVTNHTFTAVNADQTISATFTGVPPVRLTLQSGNNVFSTIGQAVAATPVNTAATIDAQAVQTADNGLTLNRGITLTFRGGYGAGFSGVVGMTTVTGPVTVTTGSLTVSNLVIK